MVKNPPNNLWIIAAVLAPIAVVTLIIIIITAVLCRKNKNDFKADAIGNLNPRAKVFVYLRIIFCVNCLCWNTTHTYTVKNIFSYFQMAYRRDVGYYHQVSDSLCFLSLLICVFIFRAQLHQQWGLNGILHRHHL